MPARKGKKPAGTGFDEDQVQAKEDTGTLSKKHVASEEEEIEKGMEDGGSKPKRGRGRPRNATKLAEEPKDNGSPVKKRRNAKEENNEHEKGEKAPQQKRGRPKKNVNIETISETDKKENSAKAKSARKDQVQLTVEHCKS